MYREGFVFAYPMQSKSQGGEALNVVTRDIGVPNTLISDNPGKQLVTQTGPQECICCCQIDCRTTELYSPWHNMAEEMIKNT